MVPGDIILMHFRPSFLADFDAALAAARLSNLRIANLTDYLSPTQASPVEQARQDLALTAFPAVRAAVQPVPLHAPSVPTCRAPVATVAGPPSGNLPDCRPEDETSGSRQGGSV